MHQVGYVLTDGFQLMALATQTAFEMANIVAREPFYAITNYVLNDCEARSSSGLIVSAHPLNRRSKADTWMIAGVLNPLASPQPEAVISFVQRASTRARRVAGICTGAFLLAEAGLLDRRRATTHWAYANAMQSLYPDVQVEADRIFVIDGTVWTSAGMTAGLDLALAMIEKDLGEEVARAVAHKLVMNQRRTGGQSQHSELLELAPKSDRIQTALSYIRANLNQALTVQDLASVAHLSSRQFSRVFTTETGRSPAKAVEGLRVEAARLLIEKSRHSLDTIARDTGFRDRRHMREVFLRNLGVSPQSVRSGVRTSPA
ncbi:GlxA family transcriptional regulator [Variovorax sp. J2P1-59]|uniref:GlxA family transcriptional regulator n=1 Tax=Variovorax flavidus TaxID=3053501 RepID=UPI0025768E56|nr:GlxA family transcriptional regulator [Variovorax sp. J2P1-59]MDM0078113.1 GlxA family transcriptional regulator [Variovorax sp. J2P1-59]